jgi:tRNA threonylcarbamoyladenosine biosynthesis protein TsaB
MKILAIDTSSMVASAAIMDEEKLAAEYIINHEKTHSEQLMPIIEELLESCGINIEEIDAIAVSSGPGSFTGLRIGGATAKGLAHAHNKKLIGVPTLDGLAFNLPYCQGIICPIMDARRNQVYTALYKWDQGNFYKLKPHCAVALSELLEGLKAREEMVIFLGDGVPVHRELIQSTLGVRARFAPRNADRQRASSIAELAMEALKRGEGGSGDGFVPFYLRKSQAEREYDKKVCRRDKK